MLYIQQVKTRYFIPLANAHLPIWCGAFYNVLPFLSLFFLTPPFNKGQVCLLSFSS